MSHCAEHDVSLRPPSYHRTATAKFHGKRDEVVAALELHVDAAPRLIDAVTVEQHTRGGGVAALLADATAR